MDQAARRRCLQWFEARVADGTIMHQVYTSVDNDDGFTFHVDCTKLLVDCLEAILKNAPLAPIVKVPLSQDYYLHILKHGGIEEPKVRRLREPYLSVPGILLNRTDKGFQITADGNHRVVRRWRDGHSHIRMFLVEPDVWKNYLVDYPPELEEFLKERM